MGLLTEMHDFRIIYVHERMAISGGIFHKKKECFSVFSRSKFFYHFCRTILLSFFIETFNDIAYSNIYNNVQVIFITVMKLNNYMRYKNQISKI